MLLQGNTATVTPSRHFGLEVTRLGDFTTVDRDASCADGLRTRKFHSQNGDTLSDQLVAFCEPPETSNASDETQIRAKGLV
jgi:hypothetical protein